jgi:hypothetical protein
MPSMDLSHQKVCSGVVDRGSIIFFFFHFNFVCPLPLSNVLQSRVLSLFQIYANGRHPTNFFLFFFVSTALMP